MYLRRLVTFQKNSFPSFQPWNTRAIIILFFVSGASVQQTAQEVKKTLMHGVSGTSVASTRHLSITKGPYFTVYWYCQQRNGLLEQDMRENIICEPKSCFMVMFSVWGLEGDWAVKTATAGVKSITRWGLWGVACGCIKGGGQ